MCLTLPLNQLVDSDDDDNLEGALKLKLALGKHNWPKLSKSDANYMLMCLTLPLDWIVDLDDGDNSDDDEEEEVNEDNIIEEALRIAQELKAQKEQLIKCRKVSEDKPAEREKQDSPMVSHFRLWIYNQLIIDITSHSVFVLWSECCLVETTSMS